MIGAMELQPDDGPRSSLSIGLGFGRCSEISSKFARRFTKRIRKLAENTPGDRQKKTGRLTARMSEAARLAGWDLTESSVGDSQKGLGSSVRTHREITERRP
ncbi:hypothetical protein B296_00026467 [Ensete ventricosum]|uniref:Uncharacterized protein n=1 Tax=Ensete ventricosum TaxID=4639 RepID=A0A426XTD2_ENSVE|nr:hypothetical protein B296_00026467 [Ensete ventricosum]